MFYLAIALLFILRLRFNKPIINIKYSIGYVITMTKTKCPGARCSMKTRTVLEGPVLYIKTARRLVSVLLVFMRDVAPCGSVLMSHGLQNFFLNNPI